MSPGITRHFCDGTFGQLHFRSVTPASAELPTVVCLHMSPKSGRLFEQLMPELAQHRQVLAPDYPGHGESDLPPADPPVTIRDYADAVWQVVDAHVGSQPVHLVGHHTGSMVAVEATRQRPHQVRRVINIGAPVFTSEELEALKRLFEPIDLDEQGTRFRVMWQRVLEHRGPGMTLPMAAESMAENLRAGDAYEWGHRAAFDHAPTYVEHLSALENRVLVMNPADDTFESTRRIDAYLRNGERRDYPMWGHGFLSAFADEAAKEMLQFFAPGDHETLT